MGWGGKGVSSEEVGNQKQVGTRETDLQYVMLLRVHLLHLCEECSPGEPSVLVFWRCSIALLHNFSGKGRKPCLQGRRQLHGVHSQTCCKGRNRSQKKPCHLSDTFFNFFSKMEKGFRNGLNLAGCLGEKHKPWVISYQQVFICMFVWAIECFRN